MKNLRWQRIIDDYKKSGISFDNKQMVLNLFVNEKNFMEDTPQDFGTPLKYVVRSLLTSIEATRRMYEENENDKRRLELWSLHLQSITMLENMLLINDLK